MRSWIVQCHQFNVYSTSVGDCCFPISSKSVASIAAVIKIRGFYSIFLFCSYDMLSSALMLLSEGKLFHRNVQLHHLSELKISLKKTQTKTWRWLLTNRNAGIFWVICWFSVEIYNWFLLFQGFFFFFLIFYWKIAYSIIRDTAVQENYFGILPSFYIIIVSFWHFFCIIQQYSLQWINYISKKESIQIPLLRDVLQELDCRLCSVS